MAQVSEVAAKRALVLDANILLRGVLGTRVRALIERYADKISLMTTQSCVDDATKYLPELCARRKWPVALALAVNAPVWTEDTDFFGTGVATWTTRNVEVYLGEV